MTRNPRALGLALFAALAMSAVTAQAATAANGMLTSDGPVTLTGQEIEEPLPQKVEEERTEEEKTGGKAAEEEKAKTEKETTEKIPTNRITAFGVIFACDGSTGTGHKYDVTPHEFISSGETTFTLTPHIKQTNAAGEPNCTGSLGISGTTDFHGCDYVVHTGETTGGVAGTYGGSLDIVCPTGEEIDWTIWLSKSAHKSEPTNPKCILHVPPQTGITGVHATDTGNGTIDLTGTLEGITATQTRNSILCPSGTHTNTLSVDLDLSVTGHNEAGGATGISLSHN